MKAKTELKYKEPQTAAHKPGPKAGRRLYRRDACPHCGGELGVRVIIKAVGKAPRAKAAVPTLTPAQLAKIARIFQA